MRLRAEHLQLSRESIDEIAGLSVGHSNKLLSDPPSKNFGPVSLFVMIGALGLSIALVEDQSMMERIKRVPRRIGFNVRNGASHWRNALAYALPTIKSLGRRGGRRRAEILTPEQRSESARLAARARWQRARKATTADTAKGTENASV